MTLTSSRGGVGQANFRLPRPLFPALSLLGWLTFWEISLLALEVGGCHLVEDDGAGGLKRLLSSLCVVAVSVGVRGHLLEPY